MTEPEVADPTEAALRDWLPLDGPAVAVGVARDGSVAATSFRNADAGTGFYLASVSKIFLGLRARLLCRATVLDADADVHRWLPELRVGEEITVRQLAQHSAGIRDLYALLLLTGSEAESREAAVELLLRQAGLNFAPGSRMGYSNGGYVLLEEICRRASGAGLDEWWAAEVAAPLSLEHSGFPGPVDMTPGFARDGAGAPVPAPYHYATMGDGGLVSSLGDLLEVEAALQRGLFGDYLSVATLSGEPVATGNYDSYAWGLSTDGDRVWHGGIVGGYRTHLLRIPAARVSIVVVAADSTARVVDCADSLAARLIGEPGPDQPSLGGSDAFTTSILVTGRWRLPDGSPRTARADGYGLEFGDARLDGAPGGLRTLPGEPLTAQSVDGEIEVDGNRCERLPFAASDDHQLPAGAWVSEDLPGFTFLTSVGEVTVAGVPLPASPVDVGAWTVAGGCLIEGDAEGLFVTLPRLRRLPLRPA